MAEGPVQENLRNTLATANDLDLGPFCALAALVYNSGVVVDYQSAPPVNNPKALGANPSQNSQVWGECPKLETLGGGPDYYIGQPGVEVQLTDTAEKDQKDSNLFFAGVFAGILGALAIEIFNGTFDVAETSARLRRWCDRIDHWWQRLRRDEQEQRPESPPEPDDDTYDPGPRGYL